MPDDLNRLRDMVEDGVSASRAPVALRRWMNAVKTQAKKLGCPFPDVRVLNREGRAREEQAIV
jgi:hypothetical protein